MVKTVIKCYNYRKMTNTPFRFRSQILGALCAFFVAGAPVAAAQIPSFQTPYVTRAEAVMLLLQARVANIPALVSNGEFPDVRHNIWYERYIVVAERLGIVQANPVTKRIRPEDPVTRAEFLSMAARTFGINADLYDSSYRDVAPEAWFASLAGMAQKMRLFPADPDQNTLKPDEFMIHNEVAKAVQILVDASSKKGKTTPAAPLYETISTETNRVAIVKPRGPAANTATQPHIAAYTRTTSAADPLQTPRLRQEVLKIVNGARAAAGLAPLKHSAMLETSAQAYARLMAQQGFFGHLSPLGETLKDRMERSGYYRPFFQSSCLCIARYIMGENLARGQKTAKEVVSDWLASPSHRETIMNPDFTDTGIGLEAGVWVQHFGGKQK